MLQNEWSNRGKAQLYSQTCSKNSFYKRSTLFFWVSVKISYHISYHFIKVSYRYPFIKLFGFNINNFIKQLSKFFSNIFKWKMQKLMCLKHFFGRIRERVSLSKFSNFTNDSVLFGWMKGALTFFKLAFDQKAFCQMPSSQPTLCFTKQE